MKTLKSRHTRRTALGLTAVALMVSGLIADPLQAAATYTVNVTLDQSDGSASDGICDTDANPATGVLCTLRAAIQQANATPGADIINFGISGLLVPGIPGVGVKTIFPTSELPAITEQVTVDGYSQPGSRPNTRLVGNDAILNIQLDGRFTRSDDSGLFITGDKVVVRGLVINTFGSSGINTRGDATRIEGNFIGTDPTGTQDLGNNTDGVFISGDANIVGGGSPDDRNLISGNSSGVQILQATGNKVQGNYIGTDRNGTALLGNDREGVEMEDASRNTVGGGVTEANIIAFNGDDGVEIRDSRTVDDDTGNRIQGNSIFANGGLGIDLNDDGPNLNDPKDFDLGPNDLRNTPIFTSAITTGRKTTIKGSLNSTPRKSFIVQFFANPLGEVEGQTFIGNKAVSTNAKGNVSFTFVPANAIFAANVTATATNVVMANTSEFSAPRGMATD